jgi:hypothetical protein
MLKRITALGGCILLISSCNKGPSAPPPRTPPAQPPPATQQLAPAQDVGKVPNELRSKCAHDAREWYKLACYDLQSLCAHNAREWYKHAWEEGPAIPDLVSSYTNHYSAKMGGCFIVVDSILVVRAEASKAASEKRSSTLTNVMENKDIGTADWFAHEAYNKCQVNGVTCNTPAQWSELLRPYMQD